MNIRGRSLAGLGLLALLCTISAKADDIVIPRGTPIDVLIENALSSRTAKVGDELRATLVRPLWIDGRLVLRAGTVVEGRVDAVDSRADGSRSGFVGVKFVRIDLSSAKSERVAANFVEVASDRDRVDAVLIGRAPAINWTVDGPIKAESVKQRSLRFHTSDTDVDVAAGAVVELELGEPLIVKMETDRIYLDPETVVAAQSALRNLGVYRGPIDGWLSTEIRQAIMRFQLDHRHAPTGDLDEDTIRLLGISPQS